MEVYVLYGKIYYSEDGDDTVWKFFGKPNVLEMFLSFETALKKLKEYAVVAYNRFKEDNGIVEDSFIKNATLNDLLSNYNMGESGRNIENDVCWECTESNGEIFWKMYAKNLLDDSISILANLGIKKDITED
jgi:hypothetical protein